LLNGLPAGDLNIDIAPRSLAYSVPRYDDEIPRGQTGVTIPNRKPGAKKIDTVYNEELTQELYDAIADRAKWFTRVYVTPGQNNHIMFFFETTCLYAAPTQDVRIPGVIRGPDSVQGHLPDGVDPVVTDDTYLVPVHMLPDRYWEQSQKCADCRVPLLGTEDKAWIPRTDTDTDAYTCPECGTDTEGPVGGMSGNYFLHDRTTGGEPRRNRYGPVTDEERYKYVDWLLDVEPGATMDTPVDFPSEPTTLSDGTVVDWLSPLEPVTDITEDYVPGARPFITVQPAGHDKPFVIDRSDITKLVGALKQQREATSENGTLSASE